MSMSVDDEKDFRDEKNDGAVSRMTNRALLDSEPVTQRRPLALAEDRLSIPVPVLARERAPLTVVIGSDLGMTFTVLSDDALLGRAPECSFRSDDPGVSRNHARLMRKDLGYFIEDLGSLNGTLI